MNATDSIFYRYWNAIAEDWPEDGVSAGAARLALRLAIGDAYAAGGALADDLVAIVASQAQATLEQRAAESAINQIGRLNEWLEVNAPALYHNPDLDTAASMVAAIATLKNALEDNREDAASARQELTTLIAEREALRQQMVQMDADEAGLRRQVVELQREVDRLTRQNVIATDTFNSLAEHTNGNGAALNAGWRDVLTDLTAAQLDFVESLDAGRRRFRDVPKRDRLSIIQSILRHIQRATGAEATPAMSAYDQARPAWAPQASGIPVVFGCSWLELPTLDPLDVAV